MLRRENKCRKVLKATLKHEKKMEPTGANQQIRANEFRISQ